jgi:hypothetical protein
MRRIVTTVESRRLELGGGDWIDIKRRLTAGDREVINAAIADASNLERTVADDGSVHVSGINWAASYGAQLRCSILGWGGPGFCVHDHDEDGSAHEDGSNGCAPIPLTPETIAQLDDATATRIAMEIASANPQPSKEVTAHP